MRILMKKRGTGAERYYLFSSATTVNEGQSITFTITTENVPDGTTTPYVITGISQSDLSSGSLTGNLTIVSNTAIVNFTISSDFTLEGPETLTFTLPDKSLSKIVNINDTSTAFPRGSQVFDTAGVFDWTVPTDVTRVSVVCVGAGGTAYHNEAGGGGGLAYRNNIVVTPGQVISVTVPASPTYYNNGPLGRAPNASFGNLCIAQSGENGISGVRGGFGGTPIGTVTGGGNGGRGSAYMANWYEGGGGAAGYSGNGGNGGGSMNRNNVIVYATAGFGGGGGGGGYSSFDHKVGGGGVGLYGRGTSGGPAVFGEQAGGGSGGQPGYFDGGKFGGGGGTTIGRKGGNGGIRIVWGPGRSFPTTDVGNDD